VTRAKTPLAGFLDDERSSAVVNRKAFSKGHYNFLLLRERGSKSHTISVALSPDGGFA